MTRHIGGQDGPRLHRLAQSQIGLPVAIWPYSSYIDTTPIEASPIEDEVSSDPYIIVISNLLDRGPHRTALETPSDYGYAGCHAIPNGYHCDIAHSGAAP
jgi:hypothetical protein